MALLTKFSAVTLTATSALVLVVLLCVMVKVLSNHTPSAVTDINVTGSDPVPAVLMVPGPVTFNRLLKTTVAVAVTVAVTAMISL